MNLFNLLQNVGVSCTALHSFVLGYNRIAIHKESSKIYSQYPKIEYLFYVLPIVYNKEARNVFKSSNSIYKVMEKSSIINLDLHNRAIKMLNQSYDGLNLAFNKEVLSLNFELMTIELGDKYTAIDLPINRMSQDIRDIQMSARHIGSIFAKTEERILQSSLNIRF